VGDGFPGGHITGNRQRAPACAFYRSHGLRQGSRCACRHGHVCSRLAKSNRKRATEPLAAPGHEGHLASQIDHL